MQVKPDWLLFEAEVSALLDCLRQPVSVRLTAVPFHAPGKQGWLGKVRGVLIDPVRTVESRGLLAQGDVTLDLPLSLKPSPALQRLQGLVRAHQEAQEAHEYSPDPPQPGWLKFVLWLLFLWLLVVVLW